MKEGEVGDFQFELVFFSCQINEKNLKQIYHKCLGLYDVDFPLLDYHCNIKMNPCAIKDEWFWFQLWASWKFVGPVQFTVLQAQLACTEKKRSWSTNRMTLHRDATSIIPVFFSLFLLLSCFTE